MKNFIKPNLLLFFIVCFSFALRLAAINFLNVKPISDAARYMSMATTIMNTGHMNDGLGNVAFFSSGYPLFLAPFFAIFGASPDVVAIINAVLGTISVVLVYLIAKKILPNWKWALVPAVIWATYPPAIVYAEYVAKENLMVPLLLVQTLLLLHFPKTSRPHLYALILGVIFGIELLVGAAVLFTGVLICLVLSGLFYKKIHFKKGLTLLLISALGCLLSLGPWLVYTSHELGKPVLNTNGPFNLYLGNNPAATGYFIGIQHTPIGPDWHSIKKEKGELEAMAMLGTMAKNYIFNNPGKTALLSLKKTIFFWWPPVHEGKYGNESKLEEIMRIVWLIYYLIIVILALIPIAQFNKIDRKILLLYGTIILYWVVHSIVFVLYRYRLTIMPLMSILAVFGLYEIYSGFISNKAKA